MDKIIQAAVAGVLAISAAQAQNLTSLPTASVPLSGTEPVYIVQGGVSKQVPASAIGALGTPSLAGADVSASNVKATGGVVARTLAARSGDVLSVLDFSGIDCTGTNISTTGLQAAISAQAGKTLRIPGNCTVRAQSVTIPYPGIRIVGDGDSSVLLFDQGATNHLLSFSATSTQVYLQHLKIDGNQQNNTSTLSSVRMYAAGTASASSMLWVDDVTFVNGQNADISSLIPDDSGDADQRIIHITNSRFFGGNENGAAVSVAGAVQFIATGNVLDLQRSPSVQGRAGFYVAPYTLSSWSMYSRVLMSNNFCQNMGQYSSATLGCFDVYAGGQSVVISNNTLVQPWGRGITVKSDSRTASIIGNSIIGLNGTYMVAQISILGTPSDTIPMNGNFVISGNSLSDNTGGSAILAACNSSGFVNYGGHITISENTILNPAYQGISVGSCGDMLIKGNRISGSTSSAGIQIANRALTGTVVLVEGNSLYGVGHIYNSGANSPSGGVGLWAQDNIQSGTIANSEVAITNSSGIAIAWNEDNCVDVSSFAQTVSYVYGVPDGRSVMLRPCSAANTLTIANNAGSGNKLAGGANFVMGGINSNITLRSNNGIMTEVARSAGP